MAERSQEEITYEIHALRGLRWEIIARYGADGRNVALMRARSIGRHPRVAGVRVVKDIYHPHKGLTDEITIYKSRRAVRRPATKMRANDGETRVQARNPLASAVGGVTGLVQALALAPSWSLIPRALFGTFAAFLGAVAVTSVLALLFDQEIPTSSSFGGVHTDIFVFLGIFVAVFVVGALLLAWALSPRRRVERPDIVEAPPPDAGIQAFSPPPRPRRRSPKLPKEAEEQRQFLIAYLRPALLPARGAYDMGDSYIRFGINLFVAGACEALCEAKQFDEKTASRVMAAGLRAVGVEPQHAETFANTYVEYLLADRRYMDMFACGRQAAQAQIDGEPDAPDMLCRALDEWAKPKTPPEDRNVVTVMFTGIADFDNLLKSSGDDVARSASRVHNRIVDRMVAKYRGKRIKNLQSGSMAAFISAEDAAKAAIAIRDQLAAHVRSDPSLPLAVSIGLNTGEPIAEGNDLFGVTVQLAHRITETAVPGQVLVSDTVRQHIGIEHDPSPFTFTECGPFSLKGFLDPIPLYEVRTIESDAA